jgi:hypothetical protein
MPAVRKAVGSLLGDPAVLSGAASLPVRRVGARLRAMAIGRARRWFMLFVLGVFLVARVGNLMPMAHLSPMTAATAMAEMPMHMHAQMQATAIGPGGDRQAPIPCKSPLPNCDSSVGCVFMVALAPMLTPDFVPMVWSAVNYVNVAAVPVGVALQPDLGPPILV